MPFETKCPACARVLRVPDLAVGRRAKCPACEHIWRVPPPVVDAESVPEEPRLNPLFEEAAGDTYGVAGLGGYSATPADPSGAAAEPPRSPCPMCGEMIVASAARCRFCNAIFDESLRRLEEKKTRRGRDVDQDLTAGDWIFCILCSGIACIFGIVYMIQGKPKGGKMVGISILAAIAWNIINVIIQNAAQVNR